MKCALFHPAGLVHYAQKNACPGGKTTMKKTFFSPLRPAAGAGYTPADRRLPADTGSVRPGTGGFFRSPAGHCSFGSRPGQRRRAALRSGQRELSAGRPERWGRGLGTPAGLSDRCRGGGNAHQHGRTRRSRRRPSRPTAMRSTAATMPPQPASGWLSVRPRHGGRDI